MGSRKHRKNALGLFGAVPADLGRPKQTNRIGASQAAPSRCVPAPVAAPAVQYGGPAGDPWWAPPLNFEPTAPHCRWASPRTGSFFGLLKCHKSQFFFAAPKGREILGSPDAPLKAGLQTCRDLSKNPSFWTKIERDANPAFVLAPKPVPRTALKAPTL